jgi:hypothetical protein
VSVLQEEELQSAEREQAGEVRQEVERILETEYRSWIVRSRCRVADGWDGVLEKLTIWLCGEAHTDSAELLDKSRNQNCTVPHEYISPEMTQTDFRYVLTFLTFVSRL